MKQEESTKTKGPVKPAGICQIKTCTNPAKWFSPADSTSIYCVFRKYRLDSLPHTCRTPQQTNMNPTMKTAVLTNMTTWSAEMRSMTRTKRREFALSVRTLSLPHRISRYKTDLHEADLCEKDDCWNTRSEFAPFCGERKSSPTLHAVESSWLRYVIPLANRCCGDICEDECLEGESFCDKRKLLMLGPHSS